MPPEKLLLLQIDESDARGNVLRAKLALLEGREGDLPTNRRMLKERIRQYEAAISRLQEAVSTPESPADQPQQ